MWNIECSVILPVKEGWGGVPNLGVKYKKELRIGRNSQEMFAKEEEFWGFQVGVKMYFQVPLFAGVICQQEQQTFPKKGWPP